MPGRDPGSSTGDLTIPLSTSGNLVQSPCAFGGASLLLKGATTLDLDLNMDIAPGKGCCALLLCLVIRYALLMCFPTASLASHLGAQQGAQIGIPSYSDGSCSSHGGLRSFNFMPSLREYQAGRPFGFGAVSFSVFVLIFDFACLLAVSWPPCCHLSMRTMYHHHDEGPQSQSGPNRNSNCVLLGRLVRIVGSSLWLSLLSSSSYCVDLAYRYSALCRLS